MPTVEFTRNTFVNGELCQVGEIKEVSKADADELKKIGKAKDPEEGAAKSAASDSDFEVQRNLEGLANILDLSNKDTIALLKDYGFTAAKKGADEVPAEIFNKVVEDKTISVADLALKLEKSVEETLQILNEGQGIEVGDETARITTDLAEEILAEVKAATE